VVGDVIRRHMDLRAVLMSDQLPDKKEERDCIEDIDERGVPFWILADSCCSHLVAIPESIILAIGVPMISPLRRKEVCPSLFQQLSSRIAVVGIVTNYSLGSSPGSSGLPFRTAMSAITSSKSLISAGEAESV
jgi:hypothetical protein